MNLEVLSYNPLIHVTLFQGLKQICNIFLKWLTKFQIQRIWSISWNVERHLWHFWQPSYISQSVLFVSVKSYVLLWCDGEYLKKQKDLHPYSSPSSHKMKSRESIWFLIRTFAGTSSLKGVLYVLLVGVTDGGDTCTHRVMMSYVDL